MIEHVDIISVRSGIKNKTHDAIIRESSLSICLNDNLLTSIICSPALLKELALGYLFVKGIIHSPDNIKSITINNNSLECRVYLNNMDRHEHYDKFDYLPSNNENISVSSQSINIIAEKFSHQSSLFIKTGAVHSCGLFKNKKLLLFTEDIGRFNAVDKMVGKCLLKKINTTDKIIAVSCRLSSELIDKIRRLNIPIIISPSAPTDKAVSLAEIYGITLIGFARENRMNIYTHAFRIN